jgi:hypothetical protein
MNMPMTTDDPKSGPVAELVAGMADCIFAFGVILANYGVATREELAREFDHVVAQQANRHEQQRRRGQPVGDLAALHYMPRALAELFRLPVSKGLYVVPPATDPPEQG